MGAGEEIGVCVGALVMSLVCRVVGHIKKVQVLIDVRKGSSCKCFCASSGHCVCQSETAQVLSAVLKDIH